MSSSALHGLQIVPIENIEGRKAAEEGDTCLRRTFSGVDLNRNWGTEWKQQVCSSKSSLLTLQLDLHSDSG